MRRPLTLTLAAIATAAMTLPALAGITTGTSDDTQDGHPTGVDATARPAAAESAIVAAADEPLPRDTGPVEDFVAPTGSDRLDEPRPAIPPEPEPGVEVLRFACELHRGDAGPVVGCKWSRPETGAPAGYKLWRAVDGNGRRVIFATRNLDETSHRDPVRPGHTYHYAVQAVDEHGRVIAQSRAEHVTVPPVDPIAMKLACDLQRRPSAETDETAAFDASTDHAIAVVCEWSRIDNDRFRGYQLWRSDGDRRTLVFASRDPGATRAVDRDLHRATTYTYVVMALGPEGHVIGQSRPQHVTTPPGVRAVKLACELRHVGPTDEVRDVRPDHQPGVACEWSSLDDDRLAGWLLWRSDGERRKLVFATRDTSITKSFDPDIRPGTTYRYAVLGVDRHGNVIARSRVVTVEVPPRPEPNPTPLPADPATHDVVRAG